MKALLLLLLCTFFAAASEDEVQDEMVTDSTEPTFTVGYVSFGAAYYDLEELNRSLQKTGNPLFGNEVFQFTLGEDVHYEQLIGGGSFSANIWEIAENNEKRTFMTSMDMNALVGYDLLFEEHMSLFPYVGVGVGVSLLHMAHQDASFESMGQGTSLQDELLWQMSLDIKTGFGYDFHLKREGTSTVFGVRAGYRFDVSSGTGWYRELSTVAGGPSLKMSGPYATLLFGIKQMGRVDHSKK